MRKDFALSCRGRWARRAIVIPALSLAFASVASDGHDHSTPAVASAASPRFEAHSDLFELVGVVEKGQLRVYLDRFATNESITGARIEFESGTTKGIAVPEPDGTYLIKFEGLSQPGVLPFAFTVAAGRDTDLLAGELELKDPHVEPLTVGKPWLRWIALGAVGLAGIVIAVLLRRRRAQGPIGGFAT